MTFVMRKLGVGFVIEVSGCPDRHLFDQARVLFSEIVFRDTVGETDFRDTAAWEVGMSYRALVGVSYVLFLRPRRRSL